MFGSGFFSFFFCSRITEQKDFFKITEQEFPFNDNSEQDILFYYLHQQNIVIVDILYEL